LSRTQSTKFYMSRAADLGCMICRLFFTAGTPAELHHPRTGVGKGQKADDRDVIPLCPEHHRGKTGVHGMGVKAFVRHYGKTEAELTELTQQLVQEKLKCLVA
jgi:hypothetical protein